MDVSRRGFFGFVGSLGLGAMLPKIEVTKALFAPDDPKWLAGLPRLCLAQSVSRVPETVQPGDWYGKCLDGGVIPLGNEINLRATQWRPRAMRFQPGGKTETSLDHESPLFKRIAEAVSAGEHYCMIGPELLVSVNGNHMTWFAGSRTNKSVLIQNWSAMFEAGGFLSAKLFEASRFKFFTPKFIPIVASIPRRTLTIPIFPKFNDDYRTGIRQS